MPRVYATPMIILHMEMAFGSAIAAHLLDGFVSVGMDVRVRRHAVGRTVHATAGVATMTPRARWAKLGRQPQDRRRHASPRHRQCGEVRGGIRQIAQGTHWD
jgi:hypothetical protein